MSEYNEILQMLLNRQIAVYFIIFTIPIMLIILIWVIPIIKKYKKSKNLRKRKGKKVSKENIKEILLQILITFILVPILCFSISDSIQNVKNIKDDIENNSYVTYTGKYHLEYQPYRRDVLRPIIHLRWVNINGEERLKLAEKICDDGAGDYEGTIVYGEKSGYIVEIDGSNTG